MSHPRHPHCLLEGDEYKPPVDLHIPLLSPPFRTLNRGGGNSCEAWATTRRLPAVVLTARQTLLPLFTSLRPLQPLRPLRISRSLLPDSLSSLNSQLKDPPADPRSPARSPPLGLSPVPSLVHPSDSFPPGSPLLGPRAGNKSPRSPPDPGHPPVSPTCLGVRTSLPLPRPGIKPPTFRSLSCWGEPRPPHPLSRTGVPSTRHFPSEGGLHPSPP